VATAAVAALAAAVATAAVAASAAAVATGSRPLVSVRCSVSQLG
jgi:hypothetical protein